MKEKILLSLGPSARKTEPLRSLRGAVDQSLSICRNDYAYNVHCRDTRVHTVMLTEEVPLSGKSARPAFRTVAGATSSTSSHPESSRPQRVHER